MLTVDLKQLRQDSGAAVQYLRLKLKRRIYVKGSQLQIESAKSREVKLLLGKFLHQRGREGFRIVAPQAGVLEVRELRRRVRTERPSGTTPHPSVTLPYFFPSSSTQNTRVSGKRWKRKF